MNISYKFVAVFSTTVLFLSCGSARHPGKSSDAMPGTWQSQPIVIDGDSKDWPSPYPNYDAKAMVAYATSNDGQNLYITMETGDPMTQMKILKQGMTVSIDTTGKKDPQFNINYPLQNDNDPLDMAGIDAGSRKDDQGRLMNKQLEQKISKNAKEANQFSLDGFGSCNGGYVISQTTPCGIKIKMRIDEYKELVWEAVIPFKAIYNRENISAADAGRPLSVCFAVKAFKHASTKSADNNTGMNNGMAGAGANSTMHSGGGARSGHGGNRGTSDDPKQHLYENTKTWKHFSIAYQH
jgi:hypothetical protein